MLERITIDARVRARRGPFMPPPPGGRRAHRAWKWGRVSASSGALLWVITWEDGTSSIEKSNCLTLVRGPSRENPAPEGSTNNETAPAPERSVPIVPSNSFGPSPGGAAASNSLQAASVPSTQACSQACSQGCSVGSASLLTDLGAPEGSTAPSTITPTSQASSLPPSTPRSHDLTDDDDDDAVNEDDIFGHAIPGGEDDAWHEERRQASYAACRALVGKTVEINDTDRRTVHTWTVVRQATSSTADVRASDFEDVGLRGGIPIVNCDVDLVAFFLKLYPGDLDADLKRMNDQGTIKLGRFTPVSKKEMLVFFGCLIGARQFSQKGRNLWETSHIRRGLSEIPDFSKYIPHWRFKQIKSLVVYLKAKLEDVIMDPWAWFRPAIEGFNNTRQELIQTGLMKVMDEAMSFWKPRKDKTGGLPNISFVMRKPKPIGTEFKCVCDADTGVMIHLEIQEGKDAMRDKPFSRDLGGTAACVKRMCDKTCAKGSTLAGDSWFGSVKSCLAVAKTGVEFIGVIKTAHKLFPKNFLESSLKDKSAGSRLVLETIIDDIPLLAIGYKYNKRKVLCFVATKGAGTTLDGMPYIQRWADDNGNLLTREVARPAIISEYFNYSPRVDNHNQSRQHDLMLEELWDTHDPWFRLHCTLLGMQVTDMWKLGKHHLPSHHRYTDFGIVEFADELAFALLANQLEGSSPSRRTGRRPLEDVTMTNADKNPVAWESQCGSTHTLRQLERKPGNKGMPQRRCRFCLCKYGTVSWTTHFC